MHKQQVCLVYCFWCLSLWYTRIAISSFTSLIIFLWCTPISISYNTYRSSTIQSFSLIYPHHWLIFYDLYTPISISDNTYRFSTIQSFCLIYPYCSNQYHTPIFSTSAGSTLLGVVIYGVHGSALSWSFALAVIGGLLYLVTMALMLVHVSKPNATWGVSRSICYR